MKQRTVEPCPSFIASDEWIELSVHTRSEINKFVMAAQRIARKHALSAKSVNGEEMKAIDTILGNDWTWSEKDLEDYAIHNH